MSFAYIAVSVFFEFGMSLIYMIKKRGAFLSYMYEYGIIVNDNRSQLEILSSVSKFVSNS